MELALKQRLLGAAVLIALAVVFLPLLVMGPAPDSGASSVPLHVPAAPDTAGDTRTLDLPLAPAAAGGAVLPTPAPPAPDAVIDTPSAENAAPAVAAGDYAVSFGSYATAADAARVVAALATAHLPAYQEAAPLGTRTVHRVRIGPYPTAAAAEAARIAAGRVRSDVNTRVVVLDAPTRASSSAAGNVVAPAASSAGVTNPASGEAHVSTAPRPATPAAAAVSGTTVTAGTVHAPVAPAEPPKPSAPPAAPAPAASNVGFAVQLGAFANPDEATRLRDRARAAGFSAFVEQVHTDHGNLSRVRVGPTADRAAADALRSQIASKLGVSGIVRPHP
ncbi:SPOR domain-containing protein [Cognatilysobacter lacus]|uniref:Sporulation protein n=1 Tax=Cognatilysobacter lacus TaxID=1643323 RepID=A0A5D8YY38_9GAMM|nr:SPOR domain-containing protein [Lysobacter lacus]TZF87156.1 sporulation protein [Lysobacter lacus]